MPKDPSNGAEFKTLPQVQGRVSKCALNSALTQGRVSKLSPVLGESLEHE